METPKNDAPAAPKSPEDYVQAAIAGLKTQKPAEDPPADGKEAPAEEPAKAEKPAEEPAKAEKPAEEPKKEEPKAPEDVPDSIKRSFNLLAQQKADLRKQQDALKARESDLALVEQAKALLAAKDPVSLLAARGFSHKQYADQLISGKFEGAEAAKEEPAKQEDAALREVRELKEELKRRDRAAARAKVTESIKSAAREGSKDRFKFVAAMGAEEQAQVFIEDYFRKTGELPEPGDWAKSIQIGLEVVEKQLRADGERWRKVLQPSEGGVTKPPAGPKSEVPQAASDEEAEQQHRTLTNSQSAAPRGTAPNQKAPQTAEDYQRAALAALDSLK